MLPTHDWLLGEPTAVQHTVPRILHLFRSNPLSSYLLPAYPSAPWMVAYGLKLKQADLMRR
jgi:hypothetical protein